MIELSANAAERTAAPPRAPATSAAPAKPAILPSEGALDVEHLARMTLGDRSLQNEVLALFNRQAELLLARMHDATPQEAAAFAHTLQGSARGVGAWHVAKAAAAVELATGGRDRTELTRMVRRLAAAIDEAKVTIADLLSAR
jgi:HPt (histidine-containing phosphotransfer) domain-containing protein